MSRRWMGVALLAGWLGVSSSAPAQYPAPPGAAPGAPAGPAQVDGVPPGFGPPPGLPVFSPPPPPVEDCPTGPEETLPPNSFSNVHPEQVFRSPRFYLDADYLLWWFKKRQVPPLVTAGNVNDPIPGALGQPGTVAVLGPGGADTNETNGGRVHGYFWFDQDHTCGIDASGFIMEERQQAYTLGGGGQSSSSLVLSRPFYNPNTNMNDAEPLVLPGVQGAHLNAILPRRFMGADANFRYSECADFFIFDRVTLLAGVRYMYLDEKLQINETELDIPDSLGNPGMTATINDNFATFNRFYGAQVGFEGETHVGPVFFLICAKVAGGETTRVIQINGNTSLTDLTSGATIVDGTRGFLVQPTNSGRFRDHIYSVVPELNVKLGIDFNEHVRLSVGYDFIYWSSIFRPGDQIDPIVNVGTVGLVGQLGSSPNPVVPFKSTGFWAQGLNVGVMVSY